MRNKRPSQLTTLTVTVFNATAKVPFRFKVINSEEVNAFSLPGGFLYVDAGLILTADNEFDVTKAHLSEIEERRQKMRQDRPVLRRRLAASTNTDSGKSADDDRPVLKRRDEK